MARHIKVKAELVQPDFTRVKVTVVDQSHFGADFGTQTDWRSSRFRYGKMSLVSCGWRGVGTGGYKTLFHVCRNATNLTPPHNVTFVDVEEWPKIKKAIMAYNKKYAAEDPLF